MSPLAHRTNLAARAGCWSVRHRRTAIFGWIAFVVTAAVGGAVLGTETRDPDRIGVGESKQAEDIVDRGAFADGADETVLVASATHTVGEPRFRAVLADVVSAISGSAGVSDVVSPLDRAGATLVSDDRHAALVRFEVSDAGERATTLVEPVLEAVAAADERHAGFRVEQFGAASAEKALLESIGRDFRRAEYTAVPITLGILIVAFGALVAAGIPLLVGLTSVIAALGLLAVVSQVIAVDEPTSFVVLLVGLAVGVDYSLFYLKREREERAAGKGSEAALEAAAATSGRAVLISGITVIAALAGMFFGGSGGWSGVAVAAIVVVAIAVAGSLTVLPATLAALGDRVERGRVPLCGRRRRESRLWGAVLERVLRRPAVSAALAASLLLLLAAPALALRQGDGGIGDAPRSLAIMQSYERIQEAFPGGPLPAVVAIEARDVTAPAVREAIARLREEAVASGLSAGHVTVRSSPNRRVALASIPLAGGGTDDASIRALDELREQVVPRTVGSLAGVEAAVTGQTAVSEDSRVLMAQRMPLAIGFVLVLAFVVLLVAFRSVVIAAKAVVLNLLSVGAAYGILVAVFQWGWGEDVLGFESPGAITAGLPLFMFAILFGLSMDYHVFILSRVREAHDRGMPTAAAVAHGIRSTAGVVSAAAFVMVAVFAVFVTLSPTVMKQLGFGLAAAILIDATVVRAVLLPAAMKLLGDWNWYLPPWLDWLPRLERERLAEEPA